MPKSPIRLMLIGFGHVGRALTLITALRDRRPGAPVAASSPLP